MLVRSRLFALCFVGCFGACSSENASPEPNGPVDEAQILDRLRAVAHVTAVTEYVNAPASPNVVPAGYRRFDVAFDQPVDHEHPEAAHFSQRLIVFHKNASAPMVLASSGYDLRERRGELSVTFAINQINVEHRYFGTSTPTDGTFAHLSARQAANDFHEITAAFKTVYGKRWIGAGASKGGETAIFHRYFFPDDTDATVAYVAPLLLDVEDERIPAFLNTVGGSTYADCRSKLLEFQKTVLRRREEIKPLIKGTYERIGGLDVAIEHGTFEFFFGFWQYGNPEDKTFGCPGIPADTAPPASIASFLEETGSLNSNIDDASLRRFAAFYVQSARELGSYASDLAPFAGLITHGDSYKIQTYVPSGVPASYDGTLLRDVVAFVKDRAERTMLIYGEYDPWTAAGAEIATSLDSFRYVAPGGNHGSVIASLAASDRARALETVGRWADIPVPETALQTSIPKSAVRLRRRD